MNDLNMDTQGVTVSLSCIDDRYNCYRLISPKAEQLMINSIKRYGQLTPVVVGQLQQDRYLLVDGFKRFRASRYLGLSVLQANILQASERALKAAMLHLNKKAHSITAMEEAMIVKALCQEHNLTQVAIATLLGFHKSWVCRRLALLERLDRQVLEQVRLGLIGPGIIRELSRLPRGNQSAALDTIRKHNMTCREAMQLVALLLERPRWETDNILYFPEPILSQREPPRPPPNKGLSNIMKDLSFIKCRCAHVLQKVQQKPPVVNIFEERSRVQDTLRTIEEDLVAIKKTLLIQKTVDVDF
jgi:ParB/RepB/Spo0J family partition protein